MTRQRLRALSPVLLALAFFAAAAALAAGHVTLRLRQLEVGHALSRAVDEQAALLEEARRLRIEVATLRSPDRVLPSAAQKLGLAPPRAERIREVLP